MKRKRGSAKRKPKKTSGAAGISVEPGYYSDANANANAKNDGNESTLGNKAKEVNSKTSSQQPGLDELVVNNGTVGSAAAKLARAISSSHANAVPDKVPQQRARIGEKEPKSSLPDPLYNKQELDAAQSVIKKIMKMDAAAPFNAPVDPIALGIPDYFDIIDTPMDFGTIISNLEKGLEYKNSEDVFKDVQRIWDNCSKYNKKGSFILERMKRVKANFMKQWNAAGLYKDLQTVNSGNVPASPQPVADSATRDEDAPYMYPGGSSMNKSAYTPRRDMHFMDQRQHQHFSPYGHPFNPQPVPPYPCSCSFHPGQSHPGHHHHHGMPPPYNYYPHMHSDHMNGDSYNKAVTEVAPNPMHSYQPSPSYSVVGHPQHRPFMHQPSPSHIAPSGLQSGINAPNAGRSHVPHRDSTSTFNKYEHAVNSGRNAGRHHHHPHQHEDLGHVPAYDPSASYMPAQQPTLSTHHQFQNSPTEVGRYNDYADNVPMAIPTQSAVNCTKRAINWPQPPVTDKTSFQPPGQINSTPEQSSSLEPEQALETNSPIKHVFSPPERLHSTADNNFSKMKTEALGLIERQDHSSSTRNSNESQPQDNTGQNQIGSKQVQPRPSLPYDNTNPKKKRGRGPAHEIRLREGERMYVKINELGQPVGIEAQKLVSYLGTLARNGNYLPLPYLDWRSVPAEYKENMWQKVQSRFEIDPVGKAWVIHNLGIRWKDWKSRLKLAHYYPHKTNEERLADCDERAIPEQWRALVAIWNTEDAQKKSARNRANRLKMKYSHATGSKSFARVREEELAKRPDGKLSRAELFIVTRTKKNGEPMNAESAKVITQLRELEKSQGTPLDVNKAGDILTEIIGPDKKGRVRCLELGPSPSDKPTRVEAIKMVSEAKAEICEIKEKMSTMEQTCAQMASQMAAMMSMMASLQKNAPEKNTPVIDTNASAGSDHSLPRARPSPSVGSTRQTRRSTRML